MLRKCADNAIKLNIFFIVFLIIKKMPKSNNRPLTLEERNQIYNEIIFGLMSMKVYKRENMTVWDLDEPEMKRFKIMLKLYRDHGKEFSGEFVLKTMKRKMIYNLYNNFQKKTCAYISKYRPIDRPVDKPVDKPDKPSDNVKSNKIINS
jgi:hypothetical protein